MSRREDFEILEDILSRDFKSAHSWAGKVTVLDLVARLLGSLGDEVEAETGCSVNRRVWDRWDARARNLGCIITFDNELVVTNG